MKELEEMYAEAMRVAMKLPPERAAALLINAAAVYGAVTASQALLEAREAELIASAKPVRVAM